MTKDEKEVLYERLLEIIPDIQETLASDHEIATALMDLVEEVLYDERCDDLGMFLEEEDKGGESGNA